MPKKTPSTKRKTPADYHALAKKRGFKWLGPEVPTVQTNTTWQCDKGHQWQTKYNIIQQGYGCWICGRGIKLPADYHALAKKKGFKWLGPEVPSVLTKTTWQCKKGHQQQCSYNNIKRNKGCLTCNNSAPKTPPDYHNLAKKCGIKWLGPEVPNTKTKTTWQCSKGHQWQTKYHTIQQGSGCPICMNSLKLPADYHAIAQKRGFKWLGPEAPNTQTKTTWQCKKGHQWQATYGMLQQGNGCPACARSLKLPADYHALAQKRGFKWLGPKVPNAQTKTTWQCSKGHQWKTKYSTIQQGSGCKICEHGLKLPADYHALAKKRGFKWLGPKVPNVVTKTTWQCKKGHQWQSSHSSIRSGNGCPVCSNNVRKIPKDYHHLAEKRGFKWTGPEVRNANTKTGWQCEQGHHWQTTYGSIQYGTGCRQCHLETLRKRRKKRQK